MPLLKRLESEVGSDVVAALAPFFPTTESFLTRPQQAGVAAGGSRAPPQDVSPLDGAKAALEAFIGCRLAPPVHNGLQLLELLRDRLRILPLGCDSLDTLLRGGLREGQLTELAGESASGKSQICMSAAACTAMLLSSHVLYIDATNSFSAQRVLQMCNSIAGGMSPGSKAAIAGPAAALANITVARPHDIHSLLTLLDALCIQLSHQEQQAAGELPGPAAGSSSSSSALPAAASGTKLIIVDSLSALVSPVLGGLQHSQGHTLMMCAARMLKQLANRFHLAVLLTNHMVAGGGGQQQQQQQRSEEPSASASSTGSSGLRPAMGDWWRGQPHARIQLTHAGPALRCATLVASSYLPTGLQAWFMVDEHGLQDVPNHQQQRHGA